MTAVSLERENNTRDRIFLRGEFDRLTAVAPMHLKPILLMAYCTGMRKSEILHLTWDRVDFKAGVIQLRPEDTKTQDGRPVPMTKELSEMLRNATIYLVGEGHRVPYVFTYAANRIGSVRRAFETACRQADLANVVFHDLRHTFVTNMRRAGVDYFRIMAISGHKTMSAFKRYHTIDHQDLHQALGQLDAHMNTSTRDTAGQSFQPIEN